jgi:hypothetical protein
MAPEAYDDPWRQSEVLKGPRVQLSYALDQRKADLGADEAAEE